MYIHMLAWCLFSRVLVETMLMLTSDDAMHYVLVYLHTREHGVFVSFYGVVLSYSHNYYSPSGPSVHPLHQWPDYGTGSLHCWP